LVYGVNAAATEGIGKALVTDVAPAELRGTALGWFNGLTGLAALPANLIGGWLWSAIGPGATFVLGPWLAFVAAGLLLAWAPWLMRVTAVTTGGSRPPAADTHPVPAMLLAGRGEAAPHRTEG
jgi:MFS family permease